MSSAVVLTFAGDSKSLDKSIKNVNADLDSVKKHSDGAASSTAELGEKLDGSTKKFRGGKDVLDGFSDSMGAMGVALPGPIGGIATMAGGLADLADGIATTVLPALTSLAAGIGLSTIELLAIVAGIAIVAAGLVLLWKKSETFRDIVKGVWKDVKVGFDVLVGGLAAGWKAIEKGFDAVVGFTKGMVKGVVGAVKGLAEVLIWPYRTAFNAIVDIYNNTLGKVHIGIHKFGVNFDFGFPQLPHFANGGAISGASIVGERGPELFIPSGPGTIVSNNQLRNSGGGGSNVTLDITLRNEDGAVIKQLRKIVRTQGGGNVQAVFGS